MNENIKITVGNNGTIITKWTPISECSQSFIDEANLRELYSDEVVLDDDDDRPEEIELMLDKLNLHYLKYFSGSKGHHYHLKFSELLKFSEEDKKIIREKIIMFFGCDKQKKTGLIAWENKPHFKTGNKKELVKGTLEEYELGNELPLFAQNKDDALIPCPWAKEKHSNGEDKTPSCSVSESKGVFNCFACGEKGTIKKLNKKIGKKLFSENNKKTNKVEISFIETNNFLVEQIFDGEPKFAIYDKKTKNISYEDKFSLDGMECFPISDEEVIRKIVKLPEKAEEYGSETELDEEIKKFIYKWLDISEQDLQIALYNIKKSWVYQRFHTLNYLRAIGDTGTGKSRFLDTLGSIHYKPLKVGGAVTGAPVFRIIEKWKGTLVVDEADFNRSDETQIIIKIINQGYEKEAHIMRCEGDNNKVIFFDPFCPKLLGTRGRFEDKATESRCMTVVMTETQRKDIPPNLNKEFHKEAQTIRNKLLMWRFRNYNKIDPEAAINIDLGDIEPRLRQIYNGYIALFADNPIQIETFKTYLAELQGNLIEERRNTPEGDIVNVLHEFVGYDEEKQISAKEIVEKGQLTKKDGNPLNPRTVGSVLKTLGFGKSRNENVNGKTKHCINLDKNLLDRLYKRYGVTYEQY